MIKDIGFHFKAVVFLFLKTGASSYPKPSWRAHLIDIRLFDTLF
ncbi:hypothetical protein KP509_10G021300 [Ceratopteris richardii]|uniref:Uncharacterized protein n=1 Tax=Ceratopteris richardii TaxID=49495 RepID=A0A8T2U2S5_CERRI|nr:hypothetical protein KP509_10G021300 [Ceratopteris richardii]